MDQKIKRYQVRLKIAFLSIYCNITTGHLWGEIKIQADKSQTAYTHYTFVTISSGRRKKRKR